LLGFAASVAIADVVEDVEQFEVADETGMVAVDDTTEAVLSARGIHGAAITILAKSVERMTKNFIVGDGSTGLGSRP
jgi:hypothetical protein